jgi:hypothetical protein
MLYTEIVAVCSQIHIKHTNTLCGQNEEILNSRLVVIKCNHQMLRSRKTRREGHAARMDDRRGAYRVWGGGETWGKETTWKTQA